jgi:hypothetical protein
MSEQKITFLFPSMRQLWDFAQAVKVNSIEVISATCTLICDCEEVDVQLATEKYGATIRESSAFSKS